VIDALAWPEFVQAMLIEEMDGFVFSPLPEPCENKVNNDNLTY
jgi:hypothetical protein